MEKIYKTYSIPSLNLDSWSETYLGARWIIENELPQKHYETLPHHGPLSQMVLLASHHMIEIILFSSIKQIIISNSELNQSLVKKLNKQTFSIAYDYWSPILLEGTVIPKNIEPYLSADKLRLRRNATIHKESALTSLDMARSALYTAVKTSQALFFHFKLSKSFKYDSVLKKYPIGTYPLFSEILYPEDYIKSLSK